MDKEKSTIENEISKISLDLENLNKMTKLKDIIKIHKEIKKNINSTNEKILKVEKLFESYNETDDVNVTDNTNKTNKTDKTNETSKVEKKNKLTDDDIYEKYSKDISEIMNTNIEDIPIETLVEFYINTEKKIKFCEKYIESKKMELIYCDDKTELDQVNN